MSDACVHLKQSLIFPRFVACIRPPLYKVFNLWGLSALPKQDPMQRQGQIPPDLMAGLIFKPGNLQKTLPQSCGLSGTGAISLSSSGSTEVPQTAQLPLLFSIRSEHTHFFSGASAVSAGAAFALVRSQEREDKRCKVKCILTWVRSRRNRVNMEVQEDASTE